MPRRVPEDETSRQLREAQGTWKNSKAQREAANERLQKRRDKVEDTGLPIFGRTEATQMPKGTTYRPKGTAPPVNVDKKVRAIDSHANQRIESASKDANAKIANEGRRSGRVAKRIGKRRDRRLSDLEASTDRALNKVKTAKQFENVKAHHKREANRINKDAADAKDHEAKRLAGRKETINKRAAAAKAREAARAKAAAKKIQKQAAKKGKK
jgi:hypothetical protein